MFKRLISLQAIGFRLTQVQNLNQNLRKLPVLALRNYATSDEKPESAETNSKKHVNPFSSDASDVQEAPVPLNDEERERRLKVLKLEADIANQEGRRVPQLDFFQDHHWEHVLNLNSKSARMKYYSFLWQIERKRESKETRKKERAAYGVQRKEEIKRENEENNHIIYGLAHTSLFLRIYDTAINHWQNNRLTRAMQFAPKIVLDCSYDQHMNAREASNAAKQLMLCFAENRANDEPYDLHYCNVDLKSHCMQALKRHIPTMLNPEFPMNIHENCFTKLFPKENLVYLTPHCRTELLTYNPDDVYIIGAMVDKINNEPLSLAKAKKLGIRMARLPLDRYLQWNAGSGKSLTLNQMINIMLDLKKTGDWNKALSHVPRRKIVDEKLTIDRKRNAIFKRAVSLSMGLDGISVEHKPPKQNPFTSDEEERKSKYKFDIDNWASSSLDKIKQNSN